MPSRARRSAGLTLIELMVVVAVIAVLASLAAPSFQGMLAAKRLEGAVSLLMTDLQNARSEAVRLNRDVRVDFSATGYSLTLPPATTPFRSVTFSQGTSITSGADAQLLYDARRGMASSTNGDTVTLGNASHSLQLRVHPMGRVECSTAAGAAKC